MGMVLWRVTMSVDGFIAGAEDDMRWAYGYGGLNQAADEVIRTTGALVMGRRTYEVEDCAGLLDEILVHVAPVLLGDGVRCVDRSAGGPVQLERTSVAQAGQLTDLRFRVLR